MNIYYYNFPNPTWGDALTETKIQQTEVESGVTNCYG